MIIVKITGGLGNQLFQYAYGRARAQENNTELKLDTRDLMDRQRSYALDTFSIVADLAEPVDFSHIGIPDMASRRLPARIQRKLFEMTQSRFPLAQRKIIREPSFTYNEDLARITNDHYCIGLWQTEKYFKKYEDVIKLDIQLAHPPSSAFSDLKKTITSCTAVSIHIRRGDYVSVAHTHSKHGVCPPEYYEKAIAHLNSSINRDQESLHHYFVFSDDIEWVKENMPILKNLKNVTYISNPDIQAHEEMILMSLCNHNIIANSSFSWWAAWLNAHTDKIIIAPQKWFNVAIETKDLIPEAWMRI